MFGDDMTSQMLRAQQTLTAFITYDEYTKRYIWTL